MSLYIADLLRSDSLFYWLRAFFVIYKNKIAQKYHNSCGIIYGF
jgi:hypothetical protein